MTKTKFPPEYIREMSMQAFEIVINRLKTKGGDCLDLAEAADAAFLLWQLSEDKSTIAMQTILENLPILLNLIYKDTERAVD